MKRHNTKQQVVKVEEIITFLNEKQLKFKGIESEDKELTMNCFLCTDKRHRLSINKTTNKWGCFNCRAGGNTFFTFKYAFDKKAVVKNNATIEKTEQEKKCTIPSDFHELYHRAIFKTKDNKCASYLMKQRGLSQDVIKHFKLGSRSVFSSRKRGEYNAGEHLVIPYIKDGKCVNVKYRSLDPEVEKEFKWKREEGGISALFNDGVLDNFDYNEIIIAEAEIDAMSVWEMGFENVISLTTGAGGFKNKPEWIDRLSRFEKIYIVLDNDQAGQDGARELASRLGLGRCYNVTLPEGIKDINEFLLSKDYNADDFQDLLSNGKKFDIQNAKTFGQLFKKFVYEKFVTGERQKASKYDTPWTGVNEIIGPLLPGFLFVLAGKPKSGKCVAPDTVVIDPRTMLPITIKDAVANKQKTIFSYNEKTKKIEECEISNWIDSGVKPLVRVETVLGRKIDTTYSHRYLTFDGWKYVSDIKIGEKIAVPTSLPYFGDNSWNENKIVVVASMIADGTLPKVGSCVYTKKDELLVEDVGNALSHFNCYLKPIGNYDYRVNSNENVNQVRRLVTDLGIDRLSKEKRIPKEVFALNKSSISKFIGVLWSHDGSVYEKQGKTFIDYSSASEGLIDDMVHLLIRFGINLKKRKKTNKLNGEEFTSWSLESGQAETVNRFFNEIKLYGEKASRKVKITEKTGRDYLLSYPCEIWETIFLEASKKGLSKQDLYRKYTGRKLSYTGHRFKIKGCCSRDMLTRLNKIINSELLQLFIESDISFVSVKSIEDIGEKQCYDLTVPKNENFLANDIVAHNTSMAMDLMKHWARKGVNTAIYSCEMRDERLHDKWIMSEPHALPSRYGIDRMDILTAYRNAIRIPSHRLHTFYPKSADDIKIAGVVSNVEELISRYGLEIIVVDNLHYLCRGGDENALISEATQQLKLLAERTNTMVVLVTHPKKTNSNKQLKNEDLKGSSSIIQDADILWLQHRPFENDDMKADEIHRGFAKHDLLTFKTDISITGRWTDGGKTFLFFSGAYSSFLDKGAGFEYILSQFSKDSDSSEGRTKRKHSGLG